MPLDEHFWVTVLSSSAVTGAVVKLVEWIFSRFSKKKRKREEEYQKTMRELRSTLEELKQDNLVLMHDRIYWIYSRFENEDEISVEDRANADYIFERYKAQGGNHKAEIMYAEICKKGVKKDENQLAREDKE